MADTVKQSQVERILVSVPTLTAVPNVFNNSNSMRKGKQEARRKRGRSIVSMMSEVAMKLLPL